MRDWDVAVIRDIPKSQIKGRPISDMSTLSLNQWMSLHIADRIMHGTHRLHVRVNDILFMQVVKTASNA